MEIEWTDRHYHVQDNANVAHKYQRMYCNTNQFPALHFCVPHSKPHGERGSSKNYNLRFDPKLDNGICAFCRKPCDCVVCTSIQTNLRYMVYHNMNKRAINLSQIALTCQYQGPLTIGKLSNCHRSRPLLTHLMKYTMLFLKK